jgi:integrase/recombinase XerC/integrase/recombinase XerD
LDPINTNVIKQLFARIKKSTGIERVHPHLLRHTFATSYIIGGGNLEFLRIMLGHSDYETTKIYLHLAQQTKMLHNDIYKLDPVFFKSGY